MPPLESTNSPFTLDLTFRLNVNSATDFVVLSLNNIGILQNVNLLSPVTGACTLENSFYAYHWHHVTISLTQASEIQYLHDLTPICTDSSFVPEASLDPLKLLFRPISSTAPQKISLSNLSLIKESISVPELQNALKPTRGFNSHSLN